MQWKFPIDHPVKNNFSIKFVLIDSHLIKAFHSYHGGQYLKKISLAKYFFITYTTSLLTLLITDVCEIDTNSQAFNYLFDSITC